MNNFENEIQSILGSAKTGDILHVRSRTLFGFAIRRMLSLGLKKCWGNHNAPVYTDQYGQLKILQIEPPSAYEALLSDYLYGVYESGSQVILVRPDVFCSRNTAKLNKAREFAAQMWTSMIGTPYDKHGIRMFARMVFRKSAHIDDNDKSNLWCTEGTLYPLAENPYMNWKPDMLKNEQYPAPIHVEHLMRQERLIFVAGDKDAYTKITEE